ncbi:hypothetical protein HSBAA_33440 [Vreelandella sulfidaeris]|uniref:Stress-induced protein n=1 Tax=Vreelandella sulfidaeris TaxID=115553 RepID=A0A455UCL2_9GAMM|nr:hypothetical protein HSBAA_33440 [Halomonas sulfidaeris]
MADNDKMSRSEAGKKAVIPLLKPTIKNSTKILVIKVARTAAATSPMTRRAAEAGHKGGQNSGGNFANDPEKASEAGQKGGHNSGGNFANDPEKASEAGKRRTE